MKSLAFTLDLDDEAFETLLLVRFLDGITVEAFALGAVMGALEKARERRDFQMALNLKKHHQADREKLKEAQWTPGP